VAPDIPAAKRAGLLVDLDRLAEEGDEWLSPEERYALKMHGVCAQAQPHAFMIRVRTGGVLDCDTAVGLARVADEYAKGWLHLTTRQQVELHHVADRDVNAVLQRVRRLGLTTRSACGHTMRGVMSCPDAGIGLEEPFDCRPDAQATSDSILKMTPELDTRMPQRINILFGGCASCRDHAKVNDIAYVSVIGPDGEPGYELWLGGSLGKSAPALATKVVDFVPRSQVLPTVHAVFKVFTEHGDFEQPAKARLKFLIRRLGWSRFLELFFDAYEQTLRVAWPNPQPVSKPLSSSIAEILAQAPEGGWGSGVRPQRTPGWAMVTVNVPLGDIDTEDLRLLADIAASFADENLYLTSNQNVMFRYVPVDAVPALRSRLETIGLGLEGADQAMDVRACTGGPVCSLALTPAQRAASELLGLPALLRNSGLRVHISGCPNACAQHQIADIGYSGGKVTIWGSSVLGYQVWLGGDLRTNSLGTVVGRVSESDVYAITSAIVGVWEALRERRETLADTVFRYGLEAFQAQINAVFKGRWEPGPEVPENPSDAWGPESERRLLMAVDG
jgi:sulfite reductase beta subunit-like hemoprotein